MPLTQPSLLTDEELVAFGKRRVLELLGTALEVVDMVMQTGGSGDAPKVAACRFVLDLALKSPFQIGDLAQDNVEAARLEQAADEIVKELLQLDKELDQVAGEVAP